MLVDSNKRYNQYKRPEYKKKFYSSAQWKRVRQSILKRDKYLCVRCKYYGRNTEAVIVHHKKPFEDYPELRFKRDNLVSVCRACHNTIHYKQDDEKKFNRHLYNKQR